MRDANGTDPPLTCVGAGMTFVFVPPPIITPRPPAGPVGELVDRVRAATAGTPYQVVPSATGIMLVARYGTAPAGGRVEVIHHVQLNDRTKVFTVTDEIREHGLGAQGVDTALGRRLVYYAAQHSGWLSKGNVSGFVGLFVFLGVALVVFLLLAFLLLLFLLTA